MIGASSDIMMKEESSSNALTKDGMEHAVEDVSWICVLLLLGVLLGLVWLTSPF